MFDFWADPVVHLLLLKDSMDYFIFIIILIPYFDRLLLPPLDSEKNRKKTTSTTHSLCKTKILSFSRMTSKVSNHTKTMPKTVLGGQLKSSHGAL